MKMDNLDIKIYYDVPQYQNNVSVNQGEIDNAITLLADGSVNNSVFRLAKAFLLISSMTHKKLQKLCYYAKAWYLALFDYNLISESFEAWVHGAVQPNLYQEYKHYGFDEIEKNVSADNIPEEFITFSKQIYDSYGHLTGEELEQLNHSEKPWIEARGNCKPWERCNNIISENTMRSFYREMINNEK